MASPFKNSIHHLLVIPALGRFREEEHLEFKASMSYILRPGLKKKKKTKYPEAQ